MKLIAKSISEYYMTQCERENISDYSIKLSGEHSRYEWYGRDSRKGHKWMPDVFQIIQKYCEFFVEKLCKF